VRRLGCAAGVAVLTFCSPSLADTDALPPAASESRPLAAPPGRAAPAGPAKAAATPAEPRAWILQTSLSLGAVLALALGGGWVIRSVAKRNGALRSSLGAGGRAPAGILEIIGRYPVGRGATLILLKLDRRVLLLSQTSGGRFGGGGFSTLAELTDPEEVASILVKARDSDGDSMAERFRSMLSRHDQGHDAAEAAATGRRSQSTPAGDTAEVWDTARGTIPVVDLTRPADHAGTASLRRRLAALRNPEGAA
jgi:flagellar biogenesis protein FliO